MQTYFCFFKNCLPWQVNFLRTRYSKAVYATYPPRHTKLPDSLFQIVLANCLADGSLYKTITKGSRLKFEYGRNSPPKEYQYDLHDKYKGQIQPQFAEKPYLCIPSRTQGTRVQGVQKSYFFRTITHPAFDHVYDLFLGSHRRLVNGKPKKTYKAEIITDLMTDVGFSYWVQDDGTLKTNNAVVLSTHCFTKQENEQMAKELEVQLACQCKS